MVSRLNKVLRGLSCVSSRGEKAVSRDTQLTRSVRQSPTQPSPPLELELTQQRAECARLEREADGLAEAKRKLEDELREVKELLEARGNEVSHEGADAQQLESETETKKLNELRTALAHAHARLSEKDKLLTERTTELSAAQAFLTRVDAVSEAEVVGMVENLNTLISSASGALSTTWDQREPVPGTLVVESDLQPIRDYFGDSMLEEVAARNPVAVTLAVEMYLVQFVEQVTSGWGDGAAAGVLGEIYGMISAKESQAIASRWRTLTKRYTPHREPPQVEEMIGDLARILVITRTFSDFSEAMESVGNSVGTELKAIIEATLRFDDTIKTKIASSDIYVYVVPRGTTFIGETMVDEFGKDGGGKEGGECGIVAGTMEIGLVQRMGGVEKVLRKPKVILERDLPELENKE